ncbi:MAG: XdhC family protein [Acidobacteriota bacterium]|nr:XdhC family protein [Blastocatellia bacterium]MDW8239984.1 XdhC family protein [Acidobacteriota bacterium]
MTDRELAQAIKRVYSEGVPAALITVLEAAPELVGAKLLIRFSESGLPELIGEPLPPLVKCCDQLVEAARGVIQRGTISHLRIAVEGKHDSIHVMIEPVRRRPELIICGAGHIGQALAPMACLLDFEVIVIDDRADYASPELFPDGVRLIAQPYAEALASLNVTPSTSIVVVTRGHKHDESCLRIVLNTPAHYIGMIGSRKRVITVFRRLLDEGYSREAIGRVHAPIGLDIGARTPAEIAVAILAEIILNKYGGTGAPKRQAVKPELHLR